MNITDKYNLSMNSANLSKLENTKKQYGNAKFSIDEASSLENNNISKYDKEFEKKRLRQVSEDFEALMINQMLKEMRKTVDKSGLIDGGMAEQIFELSGSPERFRYIPYRCVGGESVMKIFRAEKMCVSAGEEMWIQSPLLGVGETALSERGDYQIILNPDIFYSGDTGK